MEQLLNDAAGYGFPMAAAAYLLVRMESRLAKLDDAVRELARVIESR